MFCWRRKPKSKRDSGSSFGGDQIIEERYELPSDEPAKFREHGTSSTLTTAPAKAQQLLGVPSRTNDTRWSNTRTPLEAAEVGLALAPESFSQDVSPISVASYRTTSRLLPDKPSYNLFPSSLQPKPPVRPARPAMGLGDTPELRLIPPAPPGQSAGQSWRPIDTSQAFLEARQPQRTLPPSHSSKGTSRDPRAIMYAMERKNSSKPQLPRIITPNSQHERRNPYQPQSIPPPYQPRPPQRDIMRTAALHGNPAPPFSRLKPVKECVSPLSPGIHPIYPSSHSSQDNVQSQLFASAPYRSRSGVKRPPTHYTSGSETEFEDDGDDVEIVPPLPLHLSPVRESPSPNGTPLSQVRYPIIPTPKTHASWTPSESPTRKPPAKVQRRPIPAPDPRPLPTATPAGTPALAPLSSPSRHKQLPPPPPIPSRWDRHPASGTGMQEPVELEANVQPRSTTHQVNRQSAKWKILCSPGLEGLENTVIT